MTKKSQAAFEFIMTYGWAIAIATASIVALAYFGVLTPEKFLPQKCIIRPGILCLDHKIETDKVTIVLKNSLGFDMDSVALWIEKCGASGYMYYRWDNATHEDYILRHDQQKTFVIVCNQALSFGIKIKNQLNITLRNYETGINHKYIGYIKDKVE